jgi:hypothetical protein
MVLVTRDALAIELWSLLATLWTGETDAGGHQIEVKSD